MLFPWKLLWHSKVPSRVTFFSWTAALEKILFTDKLWKKGIIVLDWCCMCKKCASLDQLLLHFPITFDLWSMAFCLFGLQWVMPKRVLDMFTGSQGSFSKHRNIAVWKAVPHWIMRCLWQELNSRSFEGCEQLSLILKLFPSWLLRLECCLSFSSLFFSFIYVWAL